MAAGVKKYSYIFSDMLDIESWGPQYRGVEKVKHWLDEWVGGGKMLCHLVIDLSKKLCARSDEDETCTEEK